MMDDKEKQVLEEENDETGKEEAETTDELINKKANNKFVASENTAQIQIFVQNANFNKKFDLKQVLDLGNLSIGNDKKYDLRKREDCTEFFSACKNREYIALAIVLSVFEIIPIGDYANLKDILTEYLPAILQSDKEGKEVYVQQINPYISLDTALSVVGGKIYITDDGQKCIGYGDEGKKVLSNIWIQFPDLRKPIIDWLLRTNEIFEYKTSFEVYQVINAFIRIITEDFRYAKNHVFDRLYSEPDNIGFLARLAQELLVDERFSSDTLNMVLGWMESESNWLWKSALLVCLHTYDLDIDNQLHKAMVNTVRKRMFGFGNSELKFIVFFAGNARNVRTIVASAFSKLYRSGSIQGKKDLAHIYLKMIRYGYYQINRNKTDLPFVACDSKEQVNNIYGILTLIMTQYDLYCQLCRILQVYLEEISDYEVSAGTLNHITAFFYVLTKEEREYQKDILLFLSQLKGGIGKSIYEKLIKIYKGNEGEWK